MIRFSRVTLLPLIRAGFERDFWQQGAIWDLYRTVNKFRTVFVSWGCTDMVGCKGELHCKNQDEYMSDPRDITDQRNQ